MADGDYVRLGCAVANCNGSHKAKGMCQTHYRQVQRGGLLEQKFKSCAHCGKTYSPKHSGVSRYCSRSCKCKGWLSAHPEFKQTRERKKLPQAVKDQRAKERVERGKLLKVAAAKREREKARAKAERLHRQDAKVVACDECEIQFCPLYGSSNMVLCPCCKEMRASASKAASKALRKARERTAVTELVNPYKVFAAANWHCQICGVATPRSKRGSYDPDAPELDHIKPLAKGGEHSYSNTQCACRSCNGKKSDTWQPENYALTL